MQNLPIVFTDTRLFSWQLFPVFKVVLNSTSLIKSVDVQIRRRSYRRILHIIRNHMQLIWNVISFDWVTFIRNTTFPVEKTFTDFIMTIGNCLHMRRTCVFLWNSKRWILSLGEMDRRNEYPRQFGHKSNFSAHWIDSNGVTLFEAYVSLSRYFGKMISSIYRNRLKIEWQKVRFKWHHVDNNSAVRVSR